MAAALQAAATTSVAAVRSCFVGGTDSARQLLAAPSSVSVSGVRELYPSGGLKKYVATAPKGRSFNIPADLNCGWEVRCGRGDKRTAKGKRFKGSFGNARPKDQSKSRGLGATPLPPRPPKQEIEKDDFIQVDLDESLFSG